MKNRIYSRFRASLLVATALVSAQLIRIRAEADPAALAPGVIGYATNGAVVLAVQRLVVTNSPGAGAAAAEPGPTTRFATNAGFAFFLPDSLNHHVWTNVLARTNGRTTAMYAERTHPAQWPTNPPVVRWQPNSLLHGLRGWTAISPCWEGEVWSGQIPVTALTRRHGYTRGHGMGADGFSTNHLGRRIWFVTAQNELVTVKVARQVVRIGGNPRRDYTVFLFDRDLPAGIEPMGVAAMTNLLARYTMLPGIPVPFFKTEQTGHVSADLPGFTVPTWKGGDSGSPDMLPVRNELAFVGGRSTTGPTPEMQADMDELCRQQKLSPHRYQMRWVDLAGFPDYGARAR
jgi:hypothetical protein